MKLPGIKSVTPENAEDIRRAGEVLGESFLEEPWTACWLSALDALGTTPERKRALIVGEIQDMFAAHANHKAVYATDDMAGVAGGYLASEFDASHPQLEETAMAFTIARLMNAEEAAALKEQSRKMEGISDFDWAAKAAEAGGYPDYIYFYAWAVDAQARGTGAFRRLTQPFFDYADAHGIPCYLDCFSDDLQSLYEHVGFEVVRELHVEGLPIYERCMERKPNMSS